MADTFKCERCSRVGVGFDDYGQWLCEECQSSEGGPAARCDGVDPEEEEA